VKCSSSRARRVSSSGTFTPLRFSPQPGARYHDRPMLTDAETMRSSQVTILLWNALEWPSTSRTRFWSKTTARELSLTSSNQRIVVVSESASRQSSPQPMRASFKARPLTTLRISNRCWPPQPGCSRSDVPRNLYCLTGYPRARVSAGLQTQRQCNRVSCRSAGPDHGPFSEEIALIRGWARDVTTFSDYLDHPSACS